MMNKSFIHLILLTLVVLFIQIFIPAFTFNNLDIVADSPFDSALGSVVRGAPTFTGYIDRVLNDRVRVGKFLLTAEGIGFITKQFAFQALQKHTHLK